MPKAMPNDAEAIESWKKAQQLMQQALAYLDDGQAPAHIGAYLDLALVRLNQVILDTSSWEYPGDGSCPQPLSDRR